MASQWALVDNQFPSFQGDESVPEQIHALVNYMFVLVEQLKYNLSNLKAENFNGTALTALSQDISASAQAVLQAQLTSLEAQLNALKASVGDVSGLGGRVETLEVQAAHHGLAVVDPETPGHGARLTALEETAGTLEAADTGLRESLELIDGEVGDLQIGYDELKQVVEGGMAYDDEEKTVTLGGEEKVLQLVGTVYINGVLYGGGTDETA